jgi:hypothetical protein
MLDRPMSGELHSVTPENRLIERRDDALALKVLCEEPGQPCRLRGTILRLVISEAKLQNGKAIAKCQQFASAFGTCGAVCFYDTESARHCSVFLA